MPDKKDRKEDPLMAAAVEAMAGAHAPYSNFRVGAAVRLEDGRVFRGCNVENSSYGLTSCAERNAIFAAVAASPGGKIRISAVAVTNHQKIKCSPCGACRQVIAEFASPAAEIFYESGSGVCRSTIGELLPESFRL